jgi:hypothetical protein
LVYAIPNGAELFYYLDNSQLDVDIILSLGGERWGAFEIKLGSAQEDAAAKKLLRLRDKLVERGTKPPLFLGVITGLGTTAHKREDGVIVIPIDCLAP